MTKVLLAAGFVIMTTITSVAQAVNDVSFPLLPNESWWGGAVYFGQKMPMGRETFSFDLNGDASNNQSAPLLISTKGRWLWSEEPFRYTFRNDSVIIDKTNGSILTGKNGNSLHDAYSYASKQFFPSSGKWPDSLLITSPQYNLWIELIYNPNQHDVLNYAQKALANGYPAGVLMIDDNWANYYGEFDFNKEKFPDAKKLMTDLHSMGFKTMLWICPFISPDSEVFRELSQKKLLLLDNENDQTLSWDNARKPLLIEWWNGYSACLDLTNPSARQWLTNKLTALQNNYGVDGYKLDAGDAYFYASPRLLSYKKVSANEHSTAWGKIGLLYGLNEFRAMWKMGGQPLVERLSDKGHSWEQLQLLIPQTIAQQLVGYTFTCPDLIGGGSFTSFLPGKEINQKLMVRSAQCHALMPMMQFSAAPWRTLDEEHQKAVKKAVDFRKQYLSPIMKAISNGVATGQPVVKPLEYDYPNQGYEMVKDQFLLGDGLMVAPVVTAEDSREVVFPKGKWKYKNKIFKGPMKRTFNVALDELLIFEKQ